MIGKNTTYLHLLCRSRLKGGGGGVAIRGTDLGIWVERCANVDVDEDGWGNSTCNRITLNRDYWSVVCGMILPLCYIYLLQPQNRLVQPCPDFGMSM
ncbi:hypothetical protein PM082_000021 [Marasmius tenuissimus]|nr:hypothetical protein PM082_000021 [Marasmius tenuissimus]